MDSMNMLHGSYDYGLAGVSVALAVCASYAALDLTGRVSASRGLMRTIWLSAGAVAMGMGIWAMHYVGMLALTMPMPIYYHLPTVVLSLLAAIAASGVALFVVGRSQMSVGQEITGSVVMGSGIAAMHYIGMAAIRCSAVTVYDRRIVALSILLAVGISWVALRLAFRLREEHRVSLRKIVSALIMGSAIPLMHCTGMWAVTFYSSTAVPDLTNAIGISGIGIVAISASSFLVTGGVVASSFFDRFMALQKTGLNLARDRESYFQTMAEGTPEIIWTAGPDGEIDFTNRKWLDYSGLTNEQSLGRGWAAAIHPDDLALCLAKWESALVEGNPYEAEYRMREKAGAYRWFLVRANPVRNSAGEIVKWFGTCTDIENQKQSQQILEEQILERTTQLADVNTRLQEEMLEKDFARNELDEQNERMLTELTQRSQRATMLAKMGELLQSCISRDEVLPPPWVTRLKYFPVFRER